MKQFFTEHKAALIVWGIVILVIVIGVLVVQPNEFEDWFSVPIAGIAILLVIWGVLYGLFMLFTFVVSILPQNKLGLCIFIIAIVLVIAALVSLVVFLVQYYSHDSPYNDSGKGEATTTRPTYNSPSVYPNYDGDSDVTRPPPEQNTGYYIGNESSKKYHLPSCNYLPDRENRVIFYSEFAARYNGYEPCKKCNP